MTVQYGICDISYLRRNTNNTEDSLFIIFICIIILKACIKMYEFLQNTDSNNLSVSLSVSYKLLKSNCVGQFSLL